MTVVKRCFGLFLDVAISQSAVGLVDKNGRRELNNLTDFRILSTVKIVSPTSPAS